MDHKLLSIVKCPACGGALRLTRSEVVAVAYNDGTRDEVKSGDAKCVCGQHYPISDFVLSFAGLFTPELEREAAYWERYYSWVRAQGSLAFHDLRLGMAPFLVLGVPEAFPEASTHSHYTVHEIVAAHPLVSKGHDLLDVGVGSGWTSLHFARCGYRVTAVEPALGLAKAAKEYSMEAGVFVEYVCASLALSSFKPRSFDTVTVFHALHHEPELEAALLKVRAWLRLDGVLAIDEHVGESRLAGLIQGRMQGWEEAEVLPRYRTLSLDRLSGLPSEPHSPMEDVSRASIVPLVHRLFDVEFERSRHVVFDHYPLLYYLEHNRDIAAFEHATRVANQIGAWLCSIDPEGGDYVTIVAKNTGEQPRPETGPEMTKPSHRIPDAEATVHEQAQAPAISWPHEAVRRDPWELQRRVSSLEKAEAEQGRWAQSLLLQIQVKDLELARLRRYGSPGQYRGLNQVVRALRLVKRALAALHRGR